MRKLIYAFVLVSISLLFFQCQKEVSNIGGVPGGGGGNNNSAPLTAALQGNIVDENGAPASGVSIHVGTKSAVTNADGYFRITNASLDKNSSVVIAEKAGYFKAYRSFRATSGVNQVVIKLIKKTVAGTVSATAGGDVTLPNGSKVTLPANGIVKASGGAAYTGTVNVYTSYIDPTSSDINATVPGSFMADDKNGNRVTLASYGMLAVELESTAGEKLQIATGSKATLTAPIPSSLLSSAPATIALWYVDEQTGIWREEGTATKTGNNYVGDVKHFSFWNCDISIPSVNLSLTLHNSEGDPLVYSSVRITRTNSTGGWGTAYGWTDSLGQVSGLVPANEPLLLEVLAYPCNTVVYTQNISALSTNTNLGTITVNTNTGSAFITVKGKIVNCSGQPVTDGYALINFDGWMRYVSTDNAGDFATTYVICTTPPSTLDIIAVDETSLQQSVLATLPVTTPTTNTGTLSACGASAAQFINYTLDANSISMTLPNDSLFGYNSNWQTTPSTYTLITGFQNPRDIGFSYLHNNTAGTYPMYKFAMQNDSSTVLIQPFNIVITNQPATVGDFYEGSFSGQFTQQSTGATIHNINCTFRVRRTY